MKSKAFTLIELLAVIVILAIIALIATPIILGIIKDARETSNLRSAELYLDAAKLAIARINIEEELGDTTCTVLEYGNLNCTGIDEEVSVQVNNKEVIKGMGTLVFSQGKLMSVQNLKVGNFYYSMDANGNLVAASYVDFNITKNLTNLTLNGSTTAKTDTTTNVTLVPTNGYGLPDTITVTGTTYTYNKQTGVVALTNPTSNISVTASGIENIASKGDIITMDLDPNTESETYRVLKVNGTQVEVMSMFDLGKSKYNETGTSNTATFGDKTGQKYAGSLLDTYLNETWYNTLNSTAKAAIIAQNKTQDMWYSGADGDPDYNGTYISSSDSTTVNYTISKHSGTVSIGNRNVYALSVQDVIDYLGVTSSMTNANSTLNSSNIWQMFWNTTSKPSGKTVIWLSSASLSNSDYAWAVNPVSGHLVNGATRARAVRAAFVINLSKVEWNWS